MKKLLIQLTLILAISVIILTGCNIGQSTKNTDITNNINSDSFNRIDIDIKKSDTELKDNEEYNINETNNNTSQNNNEISNNDGQIGNNPEAVEIEGEISKDNIEEPEENTITYDENGNVISFNMTLPDDYVSDNRTDFERFRDESPENTSSDEEKLNDTLDLKDIIKETSVINRINYIYTKEQYSKAEIVYVPNEEERHDYKYTYIVRFNDYNYYSIDYYINEGAISEYDDTGALAMEYGDIEEDRPEDDW